MLEKGIAHMGVGRANGKNKCEVAAKQAINSPLLETSMRGAKNILISIAGDGNLGLAETAAATEIISADADPDAEIIFGTALIDDLKDEVIITVIATGLDSDEYGNAPIPFKSAENAEVTQTEAKETVITPREELTPLRETSSDDDFEIPTFLANRRR